MTEFSGLPFTGRFAGGAGDHVYTVVGGIRAVIWTDDAAYCPVGGPLVDVHPGAENGWRIPQINAIASAHDKFKSSISLIK
jgi:hypothetical protein